MYLRQSVLAILIAFCSCSVDENTDRNKAFEERKQKLEAELLAIQKKREAYSFATSEEQYEIWVSKAERSFEKRHTVLRHERYKTEKAWKDRWDEFESNWLEFHPAMNENDTKRYYHFIDSLKQYYIDKCPPLVKDIPEDRRIIMFQKPNGETEVRVIVEGEEIHRSK